MMKIVFLIQVASCVSIQNNNEILPPLGGNPDTVTISGYSSGGYMAQMLHVIFSSTVKGVGWVGSGPYMCAKGDLDGTD
jgi:hypothetical protein